MVEVECQDTIAVNSATQYDAGSFKPRSLSSTITAPFSSYEFIWMILLPRHSAPIIRPPPTIINLRLSRTHPTVHRAPLHRARSTHAMATPTAERLEGKTILITGASSGIGRSTAVAFARTCPRDLKLVLAARRTDALHATAAHIRADVGDGVAVLPVALDVSRPAEVRGFVAGLPPAFREIDVLVNNA